MEIYKIDDFRFSFVHIKDLEMGLSKAIDKLNVTKIQGEFKGFDNNYSAILILAKVQPI